MKTVNVLVIHSHSGGYRTWDYISENWRTFGRVRVKMTFKKFVTKDILESCNPDVLVLGDCAGAPYQFKDEEMSAIENFLEKHVEKHLLGTYALFYHREGTEGRMHVYDNRRLCELFGIRRGTEFGTKRLTDKPTYQIVEQHPLIWKCIMQPYTSRGYSSTQIPKNQKWLEYGQSRSDVMTDNTSVLARSLDGFCVVLNHVTDKYSSLYISHMPEYESLVGSNVDAQFLYNCIVFLVSQNVNTTLSDLCCKCLVERKRAYQGLPFALSLKLKRMRDEVEQ
ncbi:hypothetical protein EIN_063460 [Entamoeba invadens IP1]|uniref:hypothetical protein n=1 Tax=Entamoeba invadens IP1 TaxID=370355 RepID=UPI0002C3E2A5|nr:hypothetical protein EIN_063460 [Entamoeba invadens IP1]ELP93601.1 hypothetical protein EIN_063460 [Entamoeba invadens IP1]|eukprot:XP_004260372.1 hypothetical protein EIN_063460 [Entamoeba invadens IP1]